MAGCYPLHDDMPLPPQASNPGLLNPKPNPKALNPKPCSDTLRHQLGIHDAPGCYDDLSLSGADERGCLRVWDLPGHSKVVPFWVWYGFLVRTLIRTTKKHYIGGLGRLLQVGVWEPKLQELLCFKVPQMNHSLNS